MTRRHAEPNINTLLTGNLPFDSYVKKWSHLLMISLHCLCAKLNNRTRVQFACDVTWFSFCFDFVRSNARYNEMKMKLLISLRWIPFAMLSVIFTLSFWVKTERFRSRSYSRRWKTVWFLGGLVIIGEGLVLFFEDSTFWLILSSCCCIFSHKWLSIKIDFI